VSILTIGFPVETAGPLAQAALSAIRPLLGLGLAAALVVVFKPLIAGILRAALLLLTPRPSRERRQAQDRVRAALTLNRMAREFDGSQPGQAAELRWLASRG
jgi:hypothetical protein